MGISLGSSFVELCVFSNWTAVSSPDLGIFQLLILQINLVPLSLSVYLMESQSWEDWPTWCPTNTLSYFFFFILFFFPFLWLDKSHFSVFYLLSLYSILSSLLLNPSVRFSVLLLYSSLLWFLFSTFWPSLSLEILTLFMYCSSELGKHLFGHYFEHLSGKSLISISLRPLSSQTLSCSFI